ncbi:MAG: endonuclease/exonuclease/phosphatase family protein [Clostridia bacterium]|nr:endonuclease/exonuclease/phosphatase family protein [Clostridia bacterium]
MKNLVKIIAIVLVFGLISHGTGFLIGTIQNKNNEENGYKKAKESLNIMTLNVCSWSFDGKDLETRIDGVKKTITENNIDCLGVQEATPYWMTALNEKLGDKYAYIGVGSNTGKDYKESNNAEDEFTAIFYLKDKYNVIKSGHFWLSETPDEISYGWNSAYRRICNWVILENKYTNTQFVHLNTHFDNASSEARRHSIGMILEKVKEFKELPVIFTGDLNFLEISIGYKDITSDVLKDTKVLAKDTMHSSTFHNADPNAFKDYVLDYILINDGFKAVKYEVIKKRYKYRYISDHYAVVASVQVCKLQGNRN